MLTENQIDVLNSLAEVGNFPGENRLNVGAFLIAKLMEKTPEAITALKQIVTAILLADDENEILAKNAEAVKGLLIRLAGDYPIIQDNLQAIITHADNNTKSTGFFNTNANNDIIIAAVAQTILNEAQKTVSNNNDNLNPKTRFSLS